MIGIKMVLAFAVGLLLPGCEMGNVASESQHNATKSHHAGRNCMECHTAGERAEGWFEVAGTVYGLGGTTPAANVTVVISSHINQGGRELMRIEGDANGNFYTTRQIDFQPGLYATIIGPSGAKRYKQQPISSGACNSCHGSTQPSLRIE